MDGLLGVVGFFEFELAIEIVDKQVVGFLDGLLRVVGFLEFELAIEIVDK